MDFDLRFATFTPSDLCKIIETAEEDPKFREVRIKANKCKDPIGLGRVFDPCFNSYGEDNLAEFTYKTSDARNFSIEICLTSTWISIIVSIDNSEPPSPQKFTVFKRMGFEDCETVEDFIWHVENSTKKTVKNAKIERSPDQSPFDLVD